MVVTIERNGKTAQLTMPCSDAAMIKAQEKCDVYDVTDTVFRVTDIDLCYPEIMRLIGGSYDLDHLNLFARLADGFMVGEDAQFQAYVFINDIRDLPGMINAMANCSRYSIANSDMSLKDIGEAHYLDIHGSYKTGSISDEEFEKIGAELLESGGIDTPYGKAFVNDIPEAPFFDGKHIPAFDDSPNHMLSVFLEKDGAKEFLMLPTHSSTVAKALKRLGAREAGECKVSYEYVQKGNGALVDIIKRCADASIYGLNRLSAAFSVLSQTDKCRFFKAIEYVRERIDVDSVEMLANIAQHIDDFVIAPGCEDEYDYGRYLIAHSGRYACDEVLTDYIDYSGFGADTISAECGMFIDGDYIGIAEYSTLINLLDLNEQSTKNMIIPESNIT